jgi:hypothetical protein
MSVSPLIVRTRWQLSFVTHHLLEESIVVYISEEKPVTIVNAIPILYNLPAKKARYPTRC